MWQLFKKMFIRFYGGIICGILILGLILSTCDVIRKYIPTRPTDEERLKDNEKEKIIVNDRGDVVRVKRGAHGDVENQVAFRDSGAGKTIITLDDKGNLKFVQITHGFTFRPAVCFGTDRDGFLFGTDIQLYYFRNFGANVGVTTTSRGNLTENARGHVSISYRLPFETFRNTGIYLGYDTKRSTQIGVRIRY